MCHKKIFFLIVINFLISQDTTKIDIGKNTTDSTSIDILDSTLIPIPSLRDDKDTLPIVVFGIIRYYLSNNYKFFGNSTFILIVPE